MQSAARGAFSAIFVVVIAAIAAFVFPVDRLIADNDPDDHPGALWAVGADSVVKISTLPGQQRFALADTGFAELAATNPENGDVWVYGDGRLAAYRPDRTLIQSVDLAAPANGEGRALTVDGKAQRVWLAVGRTLQRLDHAGALVGAERFATPIADLALDRSGSRVWAATERRLVAFDPSGAVAAEIDIPANARIRALAFGDAEDRLWVAEGNGLEQRGTDGALQRRFDRPLRTFISDVSADGNGGVWLTSEQQLAHLSADGELLFTLEPFQNADAGNKAAGDDNGGGGSIRLNADPWDGSAWVLNRKRLQNYSADGELLHELTLAGEGQATAQKVQESALYADVDIPTIAFQSPEPNSFTNDATPALAVSYADVGSGVDPETLQFSTDGTNLAANCDADADAATCELISELADGFHTIQARIDDFAFNASLPAEVGFTIDTVPPQILNLEPADGATVNSPDITLTGRLSEPASLIVDGAVVAVDDTLGFNHAVTLNEGKNVLTFVAVDRASNRTAISHAITLAADLAIADIDDRTVEPGNRTAFTVTSSRPAELAVQPLPLPDNASFDPDSGDFEFAPAVTQTGSFTFTFTASDGEATASESVTIAVPEPDPDQPTSLAGRILDANAAAEDRTVPIAGATVTLLGSNVQATTDAQGRFQLSDIPSGAQVFSIDASSADPGPNSTAYASFREELSLTPNVAHRIERPFFLPRLDLSSATQVNPNQTTVVENDTIDVTLAVPAHSARNPDGSEFTGELTVSEVPRDFAPMELPDTLDPGLLVTIQPAGLRFTTPASISFPNFDGLTPDSEVDIWSLDADEGVFSVTGTGRVRPDGSGIDTISGGIRTADWHAALPPSGAGDDAVDEGESDNDDPDCQDSQNAGSTVSSKSGCLRTQIVLPKYQSQGVTRGLTLTYDSGRASPQPVIPFDATISRRAAVPDSVSYQLSVGGTNFGSEAFVSTSGFDESRDEPIRAAAGFNASGLATGLYPYSIQLTSNYAGSRVASRITGRIPVVNSSDSPLGAGWGISALARLHELEGSQILITRGNGGHTVFRPQTALPNVALSGAIERIPPPSLLTEGALESNSAIRTFVEKQNFVLPTDVALDATQPGRYIATADLTPDTQPAGADINSYFVHFDPVGTPFNFIGLEAAITFDQQVLGVIVRDSSMDNSDSLLGVPGTTYSNQFNHALELTSEQDIVDISQDRRTVEVTFEATSQTDQLRIITEGTPPSNATTFRAPQGDTTRLERDAGGGFTRTSKTGSTQHFNADGLQTRVVDRNGNATTFGYDSADRLVSVTDPSGQTTTLEYAGGALSRVTDPAGRVTRFSHDANGNLVGVALPDGSTRSFQYDTDHLMTAETNGRGFTVQRQYGPAGRLRQVTLPDGSVRLASDAQTVGFIDPTTGVGTQDNPAPRTQPVEALASFIDGEGRSRTVDAGRFGAAERIVDANGLETRIERDAEGNPVRTLLPNGAAFGRTFDAQGNVTGFTDETVGGSSSLTYTEQFNQLNSITDSKGNTTQFNYDAQGNLTEVTSAAGRTTSLSYRPDGLATSLLMPWGLETRIEYDQNGNAIRMARGDVGEARVTHISRTPEGYVETITDPRGRTTGFTYDEKGRIVRQSLPDGESIELAYDASGNLASIKPPGRPAHRFEYTSMDRENSYDPPDIGLTSDVTSRSYNGDQQLTRILRPDGQSLDFEYDPGGRLSTLRIPRDSYRLSYGDQTGNLTGISTSSVALTFGYNKDLIVQRQWSGAVAGALAESFDSERRIAARTVNGGSTISFDYEADGLLTRAGALSIARQPDNGRVSAAHIGRVGESYTYNDFAELTARQVNDAGSLIYGVAPSRDELGRIESETRTVAGDTHTLSYNYDDAGRLSEVIRDGSVRHTYSYDANGNRVEHAGPTGTETATYDDQDRLVTYAGTSYQYTANGELSAKTTTAGTTAYDYDVLGNLRAVTLPDGTEIEYVIDGRNRRVGKKVDGNLVQALLYKDRINPVAELDATGAVVARFVYADKAHVPAYMIKAGITYRLISDHRGSVRLVIRTDTGEIAQRLDYSPFGRVIVDTNPGFQPFGFAGGLYDADTGLVRFGARDYDPRVGRWTTKDPLRFAAGSTNLYGYAVDDPINIIDPDGRIPLIVALPAIGGLINGAVQAGILAFECDPSLGELGAAFGKGFASGAAGTLVGIGAGAAGAGAAIAGAAGGLAGNLAGQALEGRSFTELDPVEAGIDALVGGIIGSAGSRLFPTRGFQPSLTKFRTPSNFGKNSQRLVSQEVAGGAIGGAVGAGRAAADSNNCECP